MGRYNLTALRVKQAAQLQKKYNKISKLPPWYDVISDVPPSEILTRTLPQQHPLVRQRVKTTPGKSDPRTVLEAQPAKSVKTKKASRMFQPLSIRYEEDQLRKEFFRDHPWELARPRVILENDGKDHERYDWSRLEQPGKKLDGESVVQRQLYLLNTVPDITKAQAYDIARREFYHLRLQEDVTRRVAQEEARAYGAYFGTDMHTVGMELENQEYERWKVWAEKEASLANQKTAAFIGKGPETAEVEGTEAPDAEAMFVEEEAQGTPA